MLIAIYAELVAFTVVFAAAWAFAVTSFSMLPFLKIVWSFKFVFKS